MNNATHFTNLNGTEVSITINRATLIGEIIRREGRKAMAYYVSAEQARDEARHLVEVEGFFPVL